MLRPLISVLIGLPLLALSTFAPGPSPRLPTGLILQVVGPRQKEAILPSRPPLPEDAAQIRLPSWTGKPKIAYCFNSDDDLAAIRRAGFTHVLVSYLQGAPDAEQRRKLDECQRRGLRLIYRLVDLVDRDRRAGSDALVRHTVLLLRDHPALAGWQTFEETNLPPAMQTAVYRKIKSWDPRHPVIIVITNEYTPGWYRRTYSDDAQDVVMIDYYPYKRSYDGWPYIRQAMRALRAVQKRPIPIIPVIQASSSSRVSSAEDTPWPPPGGLEKQVNLWWSLGADAGVAFWVWRGSKEYPFVGVADREAPAYALPETKALLGRIPDAELVATGRPPSVVSLPAARIWQPRVNSLKNSGFEHGLEGWIGYNEIASLTDQAFAGRRAARMENSAAPKAIGVGQRTDLLVPPNATVTFSAFFRVVREATLLQWMIGTTAYPKFGAAAFLDGKERLPVETWRRSSVSITNDTGARQRVTGVSIISNGFTGEVLLDNLQLELAPEPSVYTASAAPRASRLRFQRPRNGGRMTELSTAPEWTLAAWSVPDMPPDPDSYACLVCMERISPGAHARSRSVALELRLRVDPRRSDPNGWVGALELVSGGSTLCRMPLALAPGQPLFWALSSDRWANLMLCAAPAGFRLSSLSPRTAPGIAGIDVVSLGSDAAGRHPLNGRASSARLLPLALSLSGAERWQNSAGRRP